MNHRQGRTTAQHARGIRGRTITRFCAQAVRLSVLATFVVTGETARAAQYWDVLQAKSGTGGGGSGNWDLSSFSWYPGSGSSDQAWNNSGTTNAAVFAGTPGTVTLTSAVGANALTFAVGGYTLTNGTLTLNGTAPLITAGAGNTTIKSVLAGAAGLVVGGGGTLTLTAGNTYTHATTVNGATLTLDFSQASTLSNILDALENHEGLTRLSQLASFHD